MAKQQEIHTKTNNNTQANKQKSTGQSTILQTDNQQQFTQSTNNNTHVQRTTLHTDIQ